MLSLALIVAVVQPWHGYVGHSHWNEVVWIPFVQRPVSTLDALANVALFVPWGGLHVNVFPASSRIRSIWTVAVLGFLMSTSFELCQVYSHTRIASTADIASNVTGALLGAAAFSGRWRLRRLPNH